MQSSTQYTSFLGGEVSESLWYRSDMDKFGKWFSNAENIRFTTMGGFENRPGFMRVGPVLESDKKPLVKLIPFVFNNEEVFEIEFITGKFRVRKHGEVIKREDGSEVVYDSPIKIESLQQLKYAQSGDIVFIASGTSPVMELRRLKTDGTHWELKEFSGKLLPLGEENEIVEQEISISPTTETEGNLYEDILIDLRSVFSNTSGDPYISSSNYTPGFYGDVEIKIYPTEGESFSITFNSSGELYELHDSIAKKINSDIRCREKQLSCETGYDGPTFRSFGLIDKIEVFFNAISEQKSAMYLDYKTSTELVYRFLYTPSYHGYMPGFAEGFYRSGIVIGERYKYNKTDDDVIASFYKENYSEIKKEGAYWKLKLYGDFLKTSGSPASSNTFYNYKQIEQNTIPTAIFTKEGRGAPTHKLSCPGAVAPFNIGDVFAVENKIDGASLSKEVTTNVSETISRVADIIGGTRPIYGNGKWRFRTSGNWVGSIQIEYSKADEENWTFLRKFSSDQKKDPGVYNDNIAGAIETDDVLKFRLKVNVTQIGTESGDGPLRYHFETDSFYCNSYYQIIGIEKPYDGANVASYYLKSLKNGFDFKTSNSKWRMVAFSDEKGYPETIGFYQNRLFFGKGYELWGSRINDFWDFYEPVDLQKDDPINMSILTYKVNTIKNILTVKSFFVFTTGGEFGIASQGALSQDDKYLKQFSSHGSNDCTPLVVGNIVLFVDSTGNTVRAFQYSFEADNYEATDISLFIEEKLKGKQIVTAEYIRSTKECLFLDADGIIWVFKYMPEQNIMSWSHWKHGQYKITNLCVTPNGAYDELYVVVDAPDGKFIERLDSSIYSDSVEVYEFEEEVEEFQTLLNGGTVVNIDDGVNNKYKATVSEYGKIKLRSPSKKIKVGLSYISTATLLTPTISLQDGTYTTFRKQRINKAYFIYKNSFGFKVGEESKEKMEVEFLSPADSIEDNTKLSSGKKSVLIPDSYESNSRISFVQEEPYPMGIINVLLESDYGGQ